MRCGIIRLNYQVPIVVAGERCEIIRGAQKMVQTPRLFKKGLFFLVAFREGFCVFLLCGIGKIGFLS